VPIVGGVACVALAVFQAVAVPSAGGIALAWLGLGVTLYAAVFAGRASAVDAFAEARDPEIALLRGRSPVVLLPIRNPANAPGLVAIANVLATPVVGRVVFLSVMRRPERSDFEGGATPPPMADAEAVVRAALVASLSSGHAPETLLTVSNDPWSEIVRLVRSERCESLLLGLSSVDDPRGVAQLEMLLNQVECDVAVLCAPTHWSLAKCERIVAAIGGRGTHDDLRARLLGSLGRTERRDVVFVQVVAAATAEATREELRKELHAFAKEETHGAPGAEVLASDDVIEALVGVTGPADLLVLGLQQHRGKRLFGEVAVRIARASDAAVLMISRRS
jgi:nucleotide-binding universal stress UspA family protein